MATDTLMIERQGVREGERERERDKVQEKSAFWYGGERERERGSPWYFAIGDPRWNGQRMLPLLQFRSTQDTRAQRERKREREREGRGHTQLEAQRRCSSWSERERESEKSEKSVVLVRGGWRRQGGRSTGKGKLTQPQHSSSKRARSQRTCVCARAREHAHYCAGNNYTANERTPVVARDGCKRRQ